MDLFLFSNPLNEIGDSFIFQHHFATREIAAEFFLAELLVQELVTVLAQIDTLLHFISGEAFFEPFVRMAETWNEMMKCQSLLTTAELTVQLFVIIRH